MAESSQKDRKKPKKGHVCPWWVGYLLVTPLRRLFENPTKILGPHVKPGMTVLEPGCGMGFFSLDLARMVGPNGRVVCADIQEKMIARLLRRARKAGLADRIETSVCTANDLNLDHWLGSVDLATAIHMLHEVPDPQAFLTQVHDLLKPGGRLLILEPKGHVTAEAFETTLALARRSGYTELDPLQVRKDRAALLQKPGG
jgi:ubiquinone/menaquinone biosynthesis C-methylase UbiE